MASLISGKSYFSNGMIMTRPTLLTAPIIRKNNTTSVIGNLRQWSADYNTRLHAYILKESLRARHKRKQEMRLLWVVVRVFCLFLLLSQCSCQRGPVPPSNRGAYHDLPTPPPPPPPTGGGPQRP
ncbi:uncharacterized protein LOC131221724 [Magnolia sinica]|uniref:uncharacterized protein LOC131221724 n=1 Tax=Magnolia sinica TaxID=86752 RepID=UPI00265AEE3F|nr:uncharacterized protein LOC131221724 [Magnolia sinica]